VPAKVQRAVKESAERLLSSTSGEFERSVGRPLFKDITDGLLIEIQQVVINAGDAALPKPLSQLAQKRLMLWVVLDSLRSPVVLSGADADRAGGRIWKQAQRVSAAISSTAAACDSRREAARAAAAADPDSQAALVTELAAIDAGDKLRLDELRYEVYTGLHEVAAVVPDATPAPAPHVDPPKPPDTAIPARSTGVRYPGNIPDPSPAEREETPAIPADLLAVLQPDAVQRLLSEFSTHMEGDDPENWWALCLPRLVNRLTQELAVATADITYSRQQMDVARQGEDAAHRSDNEELAQSRQELMKCELENDELRLKLERSEAKVEVLSEVLSRKNA
jgi:hypothetical protein